MAEKEPEKAAPKEAKPLDVTAANDFNEAAPKAFDGTSATYTFDYQKEVADFHKDFPHLMEKIFFVDMTPTSANVVKGELEDVSKFDEEISKGFISGSIKRFQPDNQSFTMRRAAAEGYFIVLARNASRKNLPILMGKGATPDIESLNTFDHEIGHAVTRDGFGGMAGSNIRENAADAFAVIRHIQRFGVDDWIRTLADTRAVELVFRPDSATHFSSPMIEAIIEASKTFDFKTLTPQQTAVAANNFAVSHSPHPRLLMEAQEAFRHINGKLGEVAKGNLGPVRDLALAVLSTDSAAVFKWGSVALRAFMDGKIHVDGVGIKTREKYWQDIGTALERREQEHGKDNFFLPKPPSSPLRPGVK